MEYLIVKIKEWPHNQRPYILYLLLVCCCFFPYISSAQFDGKPIIMIPKDQVIVQRCFIEVEGIKKTFCVAVGDPGQIHYAMDLSQGAIIDLWKGGFIDATTMWTSRGEEQLAKPLGENIIKLPSEPNVASLQNKEQAWPDSMQTRDKYQFKGYKLDEQGRPAFRYKFGEVTILDKIVPVDNDQNLTRTMKISGENDQNQLWIRLAEGQSIKKTKKGSYHVVDKNYRINLVFNKKQKPIIRQASDGMELIIPVAMKANQGEVKYSIIW